MVKRLPNRIVHHVPSSPKKLAWHIKQASRTTLVAALAVPSLSLAQEPIRLEEIIVTATKRATDLQKVPSSITALNQSTLDGCGLPKRATGDSDRIQPRYACIRCRAH